MRRFATGMFVLGLLAALPASAQIAGSMRGLSGSPASFRGSILRPPAENPTVTRGVRIAREVHDLRDEIRDAREAGQLDRREARALGREGRRLGLVSQRYAQGGYSYAELSMLRNRIEALRSAIVAKRTQHLEGK